MGTTTERFEQFVSLMAQQLGRADRLELAAALIARLDRCPCCGRKVE